MWTQWIVLLCVCFFEKKSPPPKVVNTHLTHSVTPCLGNFKHPNQLPLEALPFTQELLIVAPSP